MGFSGAAAAVGLVVLASAWFSSDVLAKTWEVGPDQELKMPSAAARVVGDGDTVEIGQGEYFDCAIWKANNLSIIGKGEGAVISDLTCQGKAIFITAGNDITIRNVTLTRARVPDGNGAGIRAEGRNLTIEHSRFVNNEDGILAAGVPGSTITIRDSEFARNGKCDPKCAHGLYVDQIALLRVEHSKFTGTKAGDAIRSLALRTELIDNVIEDGERGAAAYLVELPSGGSLLMEGNTLEKKTPSKNGAAVILGSEYLSQPSEELSFRGNRLVDDGGHVTAFVLNWSGGNPSAQNNALPAGVAEVSDSGAWWHRLRAGVGGLRDEIKTDIRGLAGTAKRFALAHW